MTKLHIDIETFSKINLRAAGAHRYAEDCELLLLAYSFGTGPTFVIDLTKEDLPDEILEALTDPNILKIAHNAAFERACLSECLDVVLPPEQWFCSLALCAIAGLPLSLDQASKVLKTGEQKDNTGKALIRYFCVPRKPTKNSPNKLRNFPWDSPQRWNQFIEYCRQDVETEKAVTEALSFMKMGKAEKIVWNLDQKINDRGVKINMDLVHSAIILDANYRKRLIDEAIILTKMENPNSVQQVIRWLNEETGDDIKNLRKTDIPDYIEKFDSKKVKRMLSIRQELSKTSVKKYYAMRTAVCHDGRLRGLFQYCGAGRTGRWGGRGSQPHNLPKGHFSDNPRLNALLMDEGRKLVLKRDAESIEMIFGAIPDLLSKLLRSAFEAPEEKYFPVSDFSAIEARVIAWLAGEKWRLDIFATHGKIYEASASRMFKVPIEEVTKGSSYRARGKIAELALGFGGAEGALAKMIKQENVKGIADSELKPIVKTWRLENPNIVNLWQALATCAKSVIRTGVSMRLSQATNRNGEQLIKDDKGIIFQFKNGNLLITLPSGRLLCYYKAHLGDGEFGPEVRYWGQDQTTNKWTRIKTYGGKLTENIVQAIARDCLAQALLNLDEAGYEIVMHVHDEAVPECDEDFGSLEEVNELMVKKVPWMSGLPLRADGFITKYYKKD